jgi:signal transduction histidine kinase
MGSWTLALDTGKISRSASHDAIFGHQPMEPEWTPATTIGHFVPEDREAVRAAFAAATLRGRVEFEHRIIRAGDGALRWLLVKGAAFNGPGGADRIAGVVADVTERRLIDEQLRQAQKMEAIGQLTGGIAHDFNNLLMIIGGSLEALSRGAAFDRRTEKFLGAARAGVARGAKLNQQLLAFARRQDMQVEVVSINDLLPTFEILLDRAVGETVSVRVVRGADLWRCQTDPNQLETAILNLAINARDAMEAGGTLTLATANVVVGDQEAARWEAAPGDYVAVHLSDTGAGMDPALLARAFEPFFTTKAVGRGTGLGLSQVYGFAKQSGGFVTIESEVGQGTIVGVYLPRSHAALPAPQAAAAASPTGDAQGVVLLVEDDADVRAASRAMLEALGYTVREAAGGEAALEALKADPAMTLVFSDVIMASGMSGIELGGRIREAYPGLPILLTSGYTAHLMPEAKDGPPVLHKPYTLDALAEAIGKVLSERLG